MKGLFSTCHIVYSVKFEPLFSVQYGSNVPVLIIINDLLISNNGLYSSIYMHTLFYTCVYIIRLIMTGIHRTNGFNRNTNLFVCYVDYIHVLICHIM